ncbi:MAG: outer membrane beta-barrel protein, partial [Bacteroidota bacterium]
EQFTWFIKENLVIKLPGQFRLQITGEYQSPAAFIPSEGGRRFGWRGVNNTAQGFRKEFWFVDAAVRKDLFKRKASLTVSIRDIFRSRRTGSYTESEFFIQDSWRIRNPQVVRVNFSYRFGKPDMSLFKRKNNNFNMNGSDMMN